MTDKEIIKALEHCLNSEAEACHKCPINEECNGDVIYVIRLALDLINRQQEQLEAAIAGQETLQKALAEKDRNIEHLNKEVDRLSQCVLYHDGHIEDAKSEAIREFAERLKEALPMECRTVVEGNDMEGITDTGFQKDDTMTTIDNLVKKMTEVDE